MPTPAPPSALRLPSLSDWRSRVLARPELSEQRGLLAELRTALGEAFLKGRSSTELVRIHSDFIDQFLIEHATTWLADPNIALFAVGGYGRGELHPWSDVDLMILMRTAPTPDQALALQTFLTFLWDCGLEVGHSVRTLAECQQEARQDVTVMTNLLEARLLRGPDDLPGILAALLDPAEVWPSPAFFEAKVNEQRARHRRFNDTAYNLEPNLKEGPGGLRDIQILSWVTLRHFGNGDFRSLVEAGFLNEEEHHTLQQGLHFLWDVRYALHVLAGRREDRLLFEHQRAIAVRFGYDGADAAQAIMPFMRNYYRVVRELSVLSDVLLQHFRETLLEPAHQSLLQPLEHGFGVLHGDLLLMDHHGFAEQPKRILQLFRLMQQHPEIRGVRAQTLRALRQARHLIDADFRSNPEHRALFMALLRAPEGVIAALRRMARYGILGAYLPAFGDVTGLMQYDLFHTYTVDEHTLFVVRNLRRLATARHTSEFPRASAILQRLPHPEILYLAALFHDIAKGRGGDHSELGAADARGFCLDHGLDAQAAGQVAWLVENHLLMSSTSQKKDLSDPAVIHAFAERIIDTQRLDRLYLLTMADMRATNPALWNDWKATLLDELHGATRRALRRGLDNPLATAELLEETRDAARARLRAQGEDITAAEALWKKLGDNYLLRHPAEDIAWHTPALLQHLQGPHADRFLILVRGANARGATEAFLYGPDRSGLFALTTHAFDRLHLDIVDARVITTPEGLFLSSYMLLDERGEPIEDPWRLNELQETLERSVRDAEPLPLQTRRHTRHQKHFRHPVRCVTHALTERGMSTLELYTSDRPGLLSAIADVFSESQVDLRDARITTFGERVEDLFFIIQNGKALNDGEAQTLCTNIQQRVEAL